MKIKEIDSEMVTNNNLCSACFFDVPSCDGNPIFGDDLGSDNVIECDSFEIASTE